ncbi:hypothetical protein [Duganella sp. BJB475]|uniref:hypothetical protein n=1 Tax=Duganella sp. BJB475 TaxID=2233914 RepID=UPI000E354941|nr:hypothetical protein [Duganella sp. BJB475]RFP19156.1 hypothetical protein D0T23_05080 [Duganella sp. BJB475]
MTPIDDRGTVAKLFDFLRAEHGLESDADLARELNRDTAYISKVRKEKIPLTSNLILFIHIHFGVGVQEIFERSGQQFRWGK